MKNNTHEAYSTKSDAQQAAANYFASLNVEPVEGKHFSLHDDNGAWGWMSLTTTKTDQSLPRGTEPEDDPEDKWLVEQYGTSHCPSCGIHLSNGVGLHGDEVNLRTIVHKEREFECLACGHEFGPEIEPDPLLRRSQIDSPTKAVWWVADEMFQADPNVRRKDVIAECVKRGIAYYTARTQYQSWYEVARRGAAKVE